MATSTTYKKSEPYAIPDEPREAWRLIAGKIRSRGGHYGNDEMLHLIRCRIEADELPPATPQADLGLMVTVLLMREARRNPAAAGNLAEGRGAANKKQHRKRCRKWVAELITKLRAYGANQSANRLRDNPAEWLADLHRAQQLPERLDQTAERLTQP